MLDLLEMCVFFLNVSFYITYNLDGNKLIGSLQSLLLNNMESDFKLVNGHVIFKRQQRGTYFLPVLL